MGITDTYLNIDSDEGTATLHIEENSGESDGLKKIDLSFRSKRIEADHRLPFTYKHPDSEESLKYTLRIMDKLNIAYIYPNFGEYVIWRGKVPIEVKGSHEYFNDENENENT